MRAQPRPSRINAERLRHRNGWTPERRLRQARAIRNWRPWTRSTGPRSAAGKARIRYNAGKPHDSSLRLLAETLRLASRLRRTVTMRLDLRLIAEKEKILRNRLLDCQNHMEFQRLADCILRLALRRMRIESHPFMKAGRTA